MNLSRFVLAPLGLPRCRRAAICLTERVGSCRNRAASASLAGWFLGRALRSVDGRCPVQPGQFFGDDALGLGLRRFKAGSTEQEQVSVLTIDFGPVIQYRWTMLRGLRIKTEFQLLGWKDEGLSWLAKGHPMKVRLARRLGRETTLSLKLIASRLRMGSWSYVPTFWRSRPRPKPYPKTRCPCFHSES